MSQMSRGGLHKFGSIVPNKTFFSFFFFLGGVPYDELLKFVSSFSVFEKLKFLVG